jgi:DNA (cytosine-5)-methyltransferase 1
MNELSLFTGTGGGLLGTHLLGWKPIGYVEFNEYCQRVIAQRIADGILPIAPIFGDVREFVQSGAAAQYRGFADVVTGGFPCQPFSQAGKQLGADDPRNMWPSTIDTVRAIRPAYCFFENVPGLLNSGYFERILCDLAESGYSVRWRCLSAAELGAAHKRDRLWIAAYTNRRNGDRRAEPGTGRSNGVAIHGKERAIAAMGNTPSAGFPNRQYKAMGRSAQGDTFKQFERSTWWLTEPDVGRVANGVASRVDRLKAIGNGQVPAVVRAAWHLLTEEL